MNAAVRAVPDGLRTMTATRGDAGERLDLVIRRHLSDLPHATRSRVQRWMRDGTVTVNGRPVARPAARAAHGDIIQVAVSGTPTRVVMRAEPSPLEVLFEDEHILAVNKPPNVVVHPTYRHATGTLMNGLLWRARNWPAGHRPSLVGRLDKLTSGIVVVAKTPRVHAALQRTLAQPVSEKAYLAVVYGKVTPTRGTIELRLARDEADRRRMVASTSRGLASVTRYERISRAAAPRAGVALLRCRLVTGRTHQIRVHLSARGWPIVGDPVYGEPRWSSVADAEVAAALRAFPRQALHAWGLAFPHPITGAPVRIQAPLPADFTNLLRASGLTPPEAYL